MTVRDRTLAHLQHLVTASALVSCSREAAPVKQDPSSAPPPPPPPATSSAPVAMDPPPVAPLPTPTASITVAKPKPTATSNHGYLVVDMLPAPARCMAVAKSASVHGGFEPDASGVKLRFFVTIKTPGVTFASTTSTAIGGALISSNFPNPTTADIEVRPTATGHLTGAQLALSCGSYGTATLVVNGTFTGAPAVGRPVTLTMTDY